MADPPKLPPDPKGTGGTNKKERVYTTYEYDGNDCGPYRVILQSTDNAREGNRRINKLAIGKLLSKVETYKKNIINLRMLGATRVLVFMKSYEVANKLQKEPILRANNLKAYIPRNFISVSGVVAGVPTDILIEEIKESITAEVPILDILRLHRYDKDEGKVPTQSISITFRSNQLPKSVRIFCCINTVRPFINKPVLCGNCLRYNHRTESCRSKMRCSKCSQQHDGMEKVECNNNIKCLYCKQGHMTTDATCPEQTRQRNVKNIMARTTLTYMEAKEQNPILTQNPYDLLSRVEEFPSIPESFATVVEKKQQHKGAKPKQQSQKRAGEGVIIAKEVEIFRDKRKKTGEEEQNGVALFNKFRVTDFERWAQHIEAQRLEQVQAELLGGINGQNAHKD